MPGAAKPRIWLPFLGVLFLAGCGEPWLLRALVETVMAPTSTWASSSVPATGLARGQEHLAAGRYGLAIADFRRAVKADPNSVEALNGLAAAYDHIGRYDLAAFHYERALALNPGSAQTLNNIGFSHMLQGKFDLATVFLRDAQQRGRGNPAIAANRAIAEAALRASRPRPGAQWHAPTDRDNNPLPRAWVERATPVVQTLMAQPLLTLARAGATEELTGNRPAGRATADTLPDMLAAPIGDTRLSTDDDRLPRPIAASMADAWIANNKRRQKQ